MSDWYKLVGREVVPFDNSISDSPITFCHEMEEWLTPEMKRVANDIVPDCNDVEVQVSTVFLGLDHGYGDGPPVVFETMVFGGKYSDEMWRYATYDEAEAGHQRMLDMVQAPVEAE